MNFDDLNAHKQTEYHKYKAMELQSQRQNENTTQPLQIPSLYSSNDPDSENSSGSFESATSSNPVCMEHLKDLSSTKLVPRAITTSEFTSQMIRCSHEEVIVKLLTSHLKELDSELQVLPFGSATYGFNDMMSDFNILLVQTGERIRVLMHIRAKSIKLILLRTHLVPLILGGSNQNTQQLFDTLEKHLTTLREQSGFSVLFSHDENRIQKKRLQMIHNASGIRCSIQFDVNSDLADSSQNIRDCILYAQICKYSNRQVNES